MTLLITSESDYQGGLFPTIPARVPGQDTLLIGADGIPRLVDDYLTTRDIRRGNYNKVARVSKASFTLDITLKATSKDAPYEFDVTIGVDYRVSDSVVYYMSKSTHNLEDSLTTALSRIVNQEARRFELIDGRASDGILEKLQSRAQYILEAIGITYSVVSVEAKPGADAEFIKQMTTHKHNVLVEQNRIAETEKLKSRSMAEAIIGQVTDGKIDMKEALEQLIHANRTEGYSKLEDIQHFITFFHKLQKDSLISDATTEQYINEILRTLPSGMTSAMSNVSIGSPQLEEVAATHDDTLNELFPDEEDEEV